MLPVYGVIKNNNSNVRAAVRMLMSDDSPASPSPESLKALNEKHPAASNALTDFTNLVIAGRCPEAVAPVFFGGRLLALSKKKLEASV